MDQQTLIKNRLRRMLDDFNKSDNTNVDDKPVLNSTGAKYKGSYPLPSKLRSTGVDKFRSSLSSTR